MDTGEGEKLGVTLMPCPRSGFLVAHPRNHEQLPWEVIHFGLRRSFREHADTGRRVRHFLHMCRPNFSLCVPSLFWHRRCNLDFVMMFTEGYVDVGGSRP